jgi:hypothetical protein
MKSPMPRRFDYARRDRPWIKPRQGTFSTAFPSLKNGHPILCDTILESDYCIWLEWDRTVSRYACNSRTFELELADRSVKYTPDFEISLSTGQKAYAEVKSSFVHVNQKLGQKINAFSHYCQQQQLTFIQVNAVQILKHPTFQTLKHIYCRRQFIDDVALDLFYHRLPPESFPMTLEALLNEIRSEAALAFICEGLFDGSLAADLRQPFNLDFVITGLAADKV